MPSFPPGKKIVIYSIFGCDVSRNGFVQVTSVISQPRWHHNLAGSDVLLEAILCITIIPKLSAEL
jgi:hypothetical protein